MNKYIVMNDDGAIIIVKNRADAEEFAFSLCEEKAYDNYVRKLMADDGMTHEEYVEQTITERDNYGWNKYTTLYGYLLDCAADCYIANMIPELD